MATSDYWNVTNPNKPWGIMDPQAILDFPIDFSDWLQEIGANYSSHLIDVDGPLNLVQSSESDGVITLRLSTTAYDPDDHLGNKYAVNIHVVADDGQEDERTVWIKLVER